MSAGPKFAARIRNQYGNPIGHGAGDTRGDAIAKANADADRTLREANRNWNWRKARTEVAEETATHDAHGAPKSTN